MIPWAVAPRGRADLNEIWDRCMEDAGIETADRLIDRLTDSFAMLARTPHAGRRREDVGEGVRSFPSGNYLIYYRKPTRGRVQILRVIHGRRDQKKAWREPSSPHHHR